MTNKEVWTIYSEYTSDLTQNARKIGFAGGAICWLFKLDQTNSETLNFFPIDITYALLFLILFFVSDILQGLSASLVRRLWILKKENEFQKKTGSFEGNYIQPKWIDRPAFIFFLLKIFFLFIAYLFLAKQIFN